MAVVDAQLVLAVLWFFIGLGVGLFLLRLGIYILVIVIALVMLPIVLSIFGLSSPFTAIDVIDAVKRGIELFATLIADNVYSFAGFVIGAVLGLAVALLRK